MSFTKKIAILSVITIVLIVGLCGCKSEDTIKAKGKIGISASDNIGLTEKVIGDVVSLAQADGENITALNAGGNALTQASHIKHFINDGYSTIALCPVDDEQIKSGIADAVAAGLKVVIFEKKVDDPNVSFFCGFDAFDQGKQAGDVIVEMDSGQPTTILEIVGPDDNSNAMQISKGFHDSIDTHSNIEVIQMKSNWNVQSTYDGVKSFFRNDPTIDIIVNTDSRLDFAIDTALDEMGLLVPASDPNHKYRVSIGGSKNGYDSAINGNVDLLLVVAAQELSENLYKAINMVDNNKELESNEYIAKTYSLGQSQVEINKDSIWGYVSGIQ